MYSAGMEVYNLDLGEALAINHRRAPTFFIWSTCAAPNYFAVEWFLPSQHSTRDITRMVIQAVLQLGD
jgi:hypothetical protein